MLEDLQTLLGIKPDETWKLLGTQVGTGHPVYARKLTVLDTGLKTRVERHEVGDHRECTASCPGSGRDMRPTLGIGREVAAEFLAESTAKVIQIQATHTWREFEECIGMPVMSISRKGVRLTAVRANYLREMKLTIPFDLYLEMASEV